MDEIKEQYEKGQEGEKENITIEVEQVKEQEEEVDILTDDAELYKWNLTYKTSNEFKKSTGKSVKNFNENEKKFYKRLQKREQLNKKKEKEKVEQERKTASLLDAPADITPIKKKKEKKPEFLYTNELPADDVPDELFIKLSVLKSKFPDIDCEIDKNMSLETLKVKYKLFMTTLETKHADGVAFSVFLLLNKGVERGAEHFFNTDMLDGLSNNVVGMKDEICEILKEMIEEGDIDTSFLTPQLRLAMVMSGVVINTIEKNTAKKKAFASVAEEAIVEKATDGESGKVENYAW